MTEYKQENIIELAKKRIILVSSADRQADEITTRFSVDIGGKLQQVRKLVIESITFPNSVYNVNTFNNTIIIHFTETPLVDTTVVLTPSFYTISEFVAHLDTQLKLADATFTATSDSKTKKITITRATDFVYDPDLSTSNALLGMNNTQVMATSQTGDALYDLRGSELLFIHTNLTTSHFIDSKKQYRNIIATLQMTSGPGETVFYHNQEDELLSVYFPQPLNVSNFTVRVRDRNGNIVDNNGLNWYMTIAAFYK